MLKSDSEVCKHGQVAGDGKRTATHEGVITFLPDIRWKALQQLEPVVLGLPKGVQDRAFQSLACYRKRHDGGFRVQGREDTCNGFDDPFVLEQSRDSISLRPQHRMGVCHVDDLVAGVGHVRTIVVADEGENSMGSCLKVKGPNEGHVITSRPDVRRYRTGLGCLLH